MHRALTGPGLPAAEQFEWQAHSGEPNEKDKGKAMRLLRENDSGQFPITVPPTIRRHPPAGGPPPSEADLLDAYSRAVISVVRPSARP